MPPNSYGLEIDKPPGGLNRGFTVLKLTSGLIEQDLKSLSLFPHGLPFRPARGRGGGGLLGILGGGVRPGSPNPHRLFQTKTCHFPHSFSD